METLIPYFIKVSVLVSLFYLSYHFLLKKETFFSKNRLFLLLGLATSVVLPMVTITKTVWIESEPVVFEKSVFIPNFSDEIIMNTIATEQQKTEINWSYIVAGLYFLGALFFLLKFVLSSLSLYKILHKTPIKKLNGYKFIDSKTVKTPFSFFSYIAFDSSSFSEEELQNIITHEKVHSNQKHSLDILLSELFLITFWFNPFVWLYKKAMVQNLEFIADSCAINQSENRINYQKTLLKITLNPESLALANPFYQPLIKKRIMMLNKIKSKKSQLWKYLVVAPLLVLFVMQVQTKVVAQTKEQTLKETIYQGKQGESALILQDTVVWIKDFAKNPNEYVNQSTGEKIIVKGGSWEDVKEHLKPQPENKILGKNPLYIINGREISYDVLEKLNIETLEFDGEVAITQYSKEEAIEKFGEKAKDGAVVIQAKNVNLKMEGSVKSSDKKDLVSFLKSAKDFKEIQIFNRYGNLVYRLNPNEKVDEEKINALTDGTYFYVVKKSSGKDNKSGYLFKGNNNNKTQETEEKAKEIEKRVSSEEFQKHIKEIEERAKEIEEKIALLTEREKQAQEKSGLSDEEIQKRFENRQEKLKEREQKLEERKKIVEERKKEYSEKQNGNTQGHLSIIGKDSSDSSIESIKSKLEKMGIQMKVSNLKRNKNGEIIKIKISLVESSGTKNNKKESKVESTIEYYDQTIPNIYVGKRNGELLIESR